MLKSNIKSWASSDPNILGGSLVFKGTRISVNRIGNLASKGVAVNEIQEDYQVSAEDIERARIFYKGRIATVSNAIIIAASLVLSGFIIILALAFIGDLTIVALVNHLLISPSGPSFYFFIALSVTGSAAILRALGRW